jgi:hypothetical protein
MPPIEWLTYDEMIRIVVGRLNCSRKRAKKIVRHAYISLGIVEPYATWVPIDALTLTNKGFLDWLSRHYAPSKSKETAETKEAVTRYVAKNCDQRGDRCGVWWAAAIHHKTNRCDSDAVGLASKQPRACTLAQHDQGVSETD